MLSASAPITLPPLPARSSPREFTRVRFRPPRAFSSSATATATSTAYASREDTASPYLNLQRMNSCTSLYEVLGIPTGASFQEIKSAYRRLARVCHPDVAAVDRRDSSATDFMKIHAAYSTLSDPVKRADYDRKLLPRYRPMTSVRMASGFTGYTRRNWETDQCW
ncbi:chaperone protein dnaJ 11, chloroplastic-like [Momordica charantia]|uniref:Chaperone protein dnaJ 11, chloroplastic-like n=1 Tax=Momordica charantia TaxID=3673 RepID=A0A6J1BWA9_MOMCH|nr:chaperone protein dnaJ 11, chloroplastic-like [Momordica charantia]